jgi:hypothetical protein
MNRNPLPALKNFFNQCMTQKDFNSRFVYLATFILCSVLMVYHTVVYLMCKTNDPQYPTIMGVLLAGHAGNGVSRCLTKLASKSEGDPTPATGTDQPKG